MQITITVIGLGPHDAQFHSLDCDNTHNFHEKCVNFASIISRLAARSEFRRQMVKFAHKITQKCAIFHIQIYSDIISQLRLRCWIGSMFLLDLS